MHDTDSRLLDSRGQTLEVTNSVASGQAQTLCPNSTSSYYLSWHDFWWRRDAYKTIGPVHDRKYHARTSSAASSTTSQTDNFCPTTTMKLSNVLTAGLVGTAQGVKFMEVDALAAQGMFNLGLNVAINGLPSPKTCNLKNVAVRREWLVVKFSDRIPFAYTLIGQPCRGPRSSTTPELSTALRSCPQRPRPVLLQVQRVVTTILSLRTFSSRTRSTEV
jgi:hypothetical protein